MANDKGMRSAVLERVASLPDDAAFTAKDFSDIADADTTRHALKTLADAGEIRRAARGVYYRPRRSALLGSELPPDVDSVARAVARTRGWTIAPSGALALNLLGLDEQVPAAFEYVSDGPYHAMDVRGTPVRFKHTANKDVTSMSPSTLLVVQALKALGQGNATPDKLRAVSARLSEDDRSTLLVETVWSTQWVREACKAVAAEGGAR